MIFPSIDIQGAILSIDTLSKIRGEQAAFQQGKDFNADFTNARLKDEISLAWQEAKGQWAIFKSKLSRLKEGESGTTETRNFWISPLLTNLGYNLTYSRQSEELNGKSFPIGYRDNSLDNFPVYIGGYNESLDRRPQNKQLSVSPHALLQEYLNYSEHLYGMVTNGRQLRLLRDASRITRLSYVEFNLEKMMDEDMYSDFVIFYRILHASRMPKKMDGGQESIIEFYHHEGLAAGSTIRNKLGEAVKGAIKTLANGFINHPANSLLREAIETGHFDENEYYRYQLRIIYRLLFLFVIEERNLVYADSKTPVTKRFNQIYFNYYSLQRLRKLAKKLHSPEANRHFDLWQGLVSTFSLFEKKEIGEKLGIMSLRGDLFGYESISNRDYDLHYCFLSNTVLLHIIRSLTYFENDNKTLLAVNYGGLDVEEFGSVYEGLLELKLTVRKVEGSELYSCNFDSSNERGKSGSHYTPEELVQPLIKHSLDYLIEDRTKPYYQKKASKDTTIQSLLSLKICDVACGSGHILLSAARRIALEIAKIKTDEEQPNPLSIRKAMKDVVRNCIYGVDKNPLAVELCKIALWLEAYNPGEPLNFLDHHVKCGDAIVGLAHRSELDNGIPDEAFKALPDDDKNITKTFRDRNIKERKVRKSTGAGQQLRMDEQLDKSVHETMAEYKTFSLLTETSPEDVEKKARAYKKFIDSKGFTFLKRMADAQVAQFFIPKIEENKDHLMTDEDFRLILSGYKSWQDRRVAMATAVGLKRLFFHWFIEFPEVFNEGGFDCVLGNPPFVAGRDLKNKVGEYEQFYILSQYIPSFGRSDLVAYFFRRIGNIIKHKGFLSLISTKAVWQGETMNTGLSFLLSRNFIIVQGKKIIQWPGSANVTVSLVTMYNGVDFSNDRFLDGKKVQYISSRLESIDDSSELKAFSIRANSENVFQGSILYGEGFKISYEQAASILKADSRYSQIIFPFLTGEVLNDSPTQEPSETVINFHDWELEKCKQFPLCLEIVKEKVYPERQKKGDLKAKEKWWIYLRNRVDSYRKISSRAHVLVNAVVSKYPAFVRYTPNIVFSNKNTIFDIESFFDAILFSTIYSEWVYKHLNTMRAETINYSISENFENYPFPQILSSQQKQRLESAGEIYHEYRRQLMKDLQLGLTKIYNLFHNDALATENINEKDPLICALNKHLEKGINTISIKLAIQGILQLRQLHIQMDKTVLDAYGWNDVPLEHNFYEVDYLPEHDRVRFTINPAARNEILKRLLDLNHKIHEEEVAKGLWGKTKASGKKEKINETDESNMGYGPLFDQ